MRCRGMWFSRCRNRMIVRADCQGEMDGLPRRRPSLDEPESAKDYIVYVRVVEETPWDRAEHEHPKGKLLENNPSSQKSWKGHWFFVIGCWEVASGVERLRALGPRRFREKSGESGELSEDEEGQLEVIHALPPSARNAVKLLSINSFRKSGLLDPIPEAMGIDMNDPKARQLLEKLLKKGAGASGSRPRAKVRSRVRPKGYDSGKGPMSEEEEPPVTKRPRHEEGAEGSIVPSPTIHLERMKDFLDTTKLVLSGEMSWEGLEGNESTYTTSTAMAFEQSVVREEAGKRDVETKAVVDRAKKVAKESSRNEVEALRALGSALVEKVELAKEVERWKEKGAQLKDENVRLQKALKNACQPQVEDVRSFLESADGAALAGEIQLSGGMYLLEKIQKCYPEFVFNLEDLVGEEEEEEVVGPRKTELAPTIEAEVVAAGGCLAEPREPRVDADVRTT
ncbi:unnamed protein product [Prunus armeniaca]|uniref:Uncharacterized protein n=1 Tax=Prunus armeniaca TaxID=36596 RepID=A0A6J5X9A9_PRUAR|nr:unnamed protein product [Prunus armeniaca]